MDVGDPERLFDPRGRLDLARITLAPRPDAAALAAGTLLFYDNEKMDVGHYGLTYMCLHGFWPRSSDGINCYNLNTPDA